MKKSSIFHPDAIPRMDRLWGTLTLTLYTDNFGVVRGHDPLSLQEGVNESRFSEVTAHLEPNWSSSATRWKPIW